MAYVNVKNWSVDQVIEWFKGLDDALVPYTLSFLNNGIAGHQLLNLRSEDLENLGVISLGHQETILESVEHLRHFHFELDKENLQRLSLKVACASNSLFKELLPLDDDSAIISLQMLSDVHNIIVTIKRLVFWLDRVPFLGDKEYIDCKSQFLDLSFEMATRAHRGNFSEKPVSSIKKICEKISKLADHIIQEISDPMILQPAFLDLATLKKREQELGFLISPNNHPIHQIVEIKYGSPAHSATKIEEGDEIVQVNYQTVVGWQRKHVMLLLQQSPPEIVLTLKKRPRHTKVYGQIYMKPYRLPSKKLENQPYFSWGENIAPPLIRIQTLSPIPRQKLPVLIEPPDVEAELSSSDESEAHDSSDNGKMFLSQSSFLQRRNTITGVTPTNRRPYLSIDQRWAIRKEQSSSHRGNSLDMDDDPKSPYLRDKSASCNLDVELSPRPTTVIGMCEGRGKKPFGNKILKKQLEMSEAGDSDNGIGESLTALSNEVIAFIDEGRELTDRGSMTAEVTPSRQPMDEALADVKISNIAKKFGEQKPGLVKPKIYPRSQIKTDEVKKPSVPPRSSITKIKSQIERSNTSPAQPVVQGPPKEPFSETKYELGIPIVESEIIKIASVTPKKQEQESTVPPKPPPRTFTIRDVKKPAYPSDSPKPLLTKKSENKSPSIKLIPESTDRKILSPTQNKLDYSRDIEISPLKTLPDTHKSISEINSPNSIARAMIYPNKSKNTKKRNSIVAKKRKVSVEDLQPCDIQGYLYQRLRNKRDQSIHWEKRWFVLLRSGLYGYKTKEDPKAACLIYLSGFTVAVANEVKSRSNAFKVYHTGTVFYFSTEDMETLQTWIDMITAATFNNESLKIADGARFSETDDDSDNEKTKNLKKTGSLKKNSLKKQDSGCGSTSLDRKRFFHKSSSHTKNCLPVPTAQFRSYRKIKTSIPQSGSVTTGNFTSHIAFFAQKLQQSAHNSSVPNLTVDHFAKDVHNIENNVPNVVKSPNYVHCSNPSLRNANESVSPSFPPKMVTKYGDNLAGFVTLEELMIRQARERNSNPYRDPEEDNFDLIQPDVVYGEVPIRPKEKQPETPKDSDFIFTNKIATYPKTTKIFDEKSNRSLPRTHKLSEFLENNKNDNALSKEEVFPDRSYEMIYCAERTTDIQFAQNRNLEDRMYKDKSIKKGFGLNRLNRHEESDIHPSEGKLNSTLQTISMCLSSPSEPKIKDSSTKKSGKLRHIFGKPNEKKRTVLESPKPHRALFKKRMDDCEVGTPCSVLPGSLSMPSAMESQLSCESVSMSNTPHADYPGLEYPPIFEPETYSLADPQSSLTLLRKQSKNSN